jgi:hypothetical protein
MKTVEVNGRTFEFQEFCQHMANAFTYLAKGARYAVEKSSYMEGMQTIWCLLEIEGDSSFQIGPTLYYSNVNDEWVGFNQSPDDQDQYVFPENTLE